MSDEEALREEAREERMDNRRQRYLDRIAYRMQTDPGFETDCDDDEEEEKDTE